MTFNLYSFLLAMFSFATILLIYKRGPRGVFVNILTALSVAAVIAWYMAWIKHTFDPYTAPSPAALAVWGIHTFLMWVPVSAVVDMRRTIRTPLYVLYVSGFFGCAIACVLIYFIF